MFSVLISLLASPVFAAPDPVDQTPLARWWGGVVEQWVQQTGDSSYEVVVSIRLKADRSIAEVQVRKCSETEEHCALLVTQMQAAGKLPVGTPREFDLSAANAEETAASGPSPTVGTPSSSTAAAASPPATAGTTEAKTPEAPAASTNPEEAAREAEMFADPREAEMFGSGPATPTTDAPVDSREAEMFGGDRDAEALGTNVAATESSFDRLISDADRRLEMGGRLYLRLNSNWPEGTSWNSSTLSAPNLLDLYADYRPDDHVRAYVDGRLNYDYTVDESETDAFGNEQKQVNAQLDEFWLKFDVKNRLFVTAGLQHLRWGTGRIWNPTDFLNPTPKDPLAVFDARTGVPLVKLHVPFEKLGANLYGVLDFSDPKAIDYIGGALRAEVAAGPGEYSLSVAARKDQPLRLGADVSMALWLFDIKGEAAVLHDDPGPYYKGDFDLSTFTFPEKVDRKDEWIPQVDVGVEVPIKYSDSDTLTLGVEYFHNGAGYEDTSILPYLLFAGGYKPLYVGQDYLAAYALLLGPGNWNSTSFILTGISDLSDQTYTTRFQVSSQIRTWIAWDFSVGYSFGEQGEFHYDLVVPPVPGVLPDGLEVPAQQLSYALGAQVKF